MEAGEELPIQSRLPHGGPWLGEDLGEDLLASCLSCLSSCSCGLVCACAGVSRSQCRRQVQYRMIFLLCLCLPLPCHGHGHRSVVCHGSRMHEDPQVRSVRIIDFYTKTGLRMDSVAEESDPKFSADGQTPSFFHPNQQHNNQGTVQPKIRIISFCLDYALLHA